MELEDVIAAIATPHGEGAIGIVRAAGFGVFEVAARLVHGLSSDPADWPSHRARHLVLHDPGTEARLDDALVIAFDRERSPIGFEMVEFHCHGSPLILARVLDALIAAGARPAQPGEFTMRAFMAGRMDLAQAEAVCDLIRAKTEASQRVAMAQQTGVLSREIDAIAEDLEGLVAHVEATIDFGDEIGDLTPAEVLRRIRPVRERVEALMATARIGRPYREGVRLAIVGRPNVGKSSLLNALLGRQRAIVADVPGTTRDTIEEAANILGIPVIAVDTAGLRHTRDTIELMGIRRTEDAVASAGVVMLVIDAGEGWTDDDGDAASRMGGRAYLCVPNKIDLLDAADRASVALRLPVEAARLHKPVCVSALTREGIGDLEQAIARIVTGGEPADPETPLVSNVRHLAALVEVAAALDRVERAASSGYPPDLLAVDLRGAFSSLTAITYSETEGVIERIFSEFCIGK